MLPAELIAESADLVVAPLTRVEFLMTEVISGAENHMVMDALFISMCSHYIRVISLKKSFCQFLPDPMRFIRRNLSRGKGLDEVISEIFILPIPCLRQGISEVLLG